MVLRVYPKPLRVCKVWVQGLRGARVGDLNGLRLIWLRAFRVYSKAGSRGRGPLGGLNPLP